MSLCNPVGVVLVLVIRFANDIEPRWGSSVYKIVFLQINNLTEFE